MKGIFKRQRNAFLLFALLFIAVLSLLLVWLTAISRQHNEQILRNDYERQIRSNAAVTVANLEAQVAALTDKLTFIGRIDAIKSLDPTVCNPELARIFKQAGSSLGNIGRIGPDGKFYCSLNKKLIGVKGSTLGSYVTTIFSDPQHKPVMSRLIKPKGSPSYLVAVHVPVYNTTGKFLGTLGGAISMDRLKSEVLNSAKPSPNGFTTLIDDDGTIMSHPESQFVGKSISDPAVRPYYESNPAIKAALAKASRGEETSVRYRAGGENRFALYTPIEVIKGRRWIAASVVPDRDIEVLAVELGNKTSYITVGIFCMALFLVIVGALTLYLNRRVFKPIEKMADVARAIRDGDFDKKVPSKGGYEILALADALNAMVTKLRSYSVDLEQDVKDKTAELLQQTEIAVAASAKDEAILASIGDGVFAVDNEKRLVLLNPAAERMSGYKDINVKGKPYAEILKFISEETGKPNTEFIDKALAGHVTAMANHTALIHENGHHISVADSAAPIKNAAGEIQGAIVVFRDVTRERELDRAKDEFLYLASHQLRTPATAVKQFLGLVTEGYAKDEKEKENFIQSAYESNDEQLQIIDDILNVAKIDAGELEFKPEKTDMNKLLDHAVSELEGFGKESGHEISVAQPDHDVIMQVDKLKLTMSIQNLINNAIKYSPDNSAVDVSLQDTGDKVIFAVKDHGIGISKEDQAKLFTKFGRIQTELTAKVQGTGLGLYMVKEFIAMHNGKISVESVPGEGTTFIIELPKEK